MPARKNRALKPIPKKTSIDLNIACTEDNRVCIMIVLTPATAKLLLSALAEKIAASEVMTAAANNGG